MGQRIDPCGAHDVTSKKDEIEPKEMARRCHCGDNIASSLSGVS